VVGGEATTALGHVLTIAQNGSKVNRIKVRFTELWHDVNNGCVCVNVIMQWRSDNNVFVHGEE
jgi:hypothetical protein